MNAICKYWEVVHGAFGFGGERDEEGMVKYPMILLKVGRVAFVQVHYARGAYSIRARVG